MAGSVVVPDFEIMLMEKSLSPTTFNQILKISTADTVTYIVDLRRLSEFFGYHIGK